MSSWQATLRIARRDALRAKGRSALVIAMIALPVLGISAVDVVARTYQLSPAQKAARNLGRADAALISVSNSPITQDADQGFQSAPEGGTAPRPDPASPPGLTAVHDLARGLPSGTSTLLDRSWQSTASAGELSVSTGMRQLAYTAPLARGIYSQRTGRAPAAPDEVALTTALADRLGVSIGDTLAVSSLPHPLRVVGVVDSRTSRNVLTALLSPRVLAAQVEVRDRLLVDVPGALTAAQVHALNNHGVLAETAAPVAGLPPAPTYGQSAGSTVAALVLVVGMALLEVVLLAGPAFAVGARRQRRQLALLSATGAASRDVRRTVLGGGLVLGLAGGVAGAVGGVALAAAAPHPLQRLNDTVPGPFEVRPLELGAIALLGVGTALLAALLPARTAARQDVVAALTGRRGAATGSRLVPALGVCAAVLGALLALAGAARVHVNVVLLGSVVAELGLVATTPALVGLAARLGPRLPLAPRLALRDAARNRSRTAPAVAAVLAAVAGSVAVGTFVASLDAKDAKQYTARAPRGAAMVHLAPGTPAAALARAQQVLRRELPAREVVEVRAFGIGDRGGFVEVAYPPRSRCPVTGTPQEPRCAGRPSASSFGDTLLGGAAVLRAISGVDTAPTRQALEAGRAVAPATSIFPDGTLHLVLHQGADSAGAHARTLTVPATALPPRDLLPTVLPPAVAARLGGTGVLQGLAVSTTRMPTAHEEDRARAGLEGAGVADASVEVERGYQSRYGVGLLALLAGSALLVLGASGIATGLAAADGLPDLATLAAVGATPVLRRVLAAAQSAVTAGLGTALGLVAGLVPAIGIIRAYDAAGGGTIPVVLPWGNLAVTALVVPLVAAAAAAAVTRSRLPLVHRAG